jgi:hypothetical protein
MNKEPIKFLIWVYFWLLIFEGALRRWVFPGASDVLLLVRDPVALLIVILGFPVLFNTENRFWVLSNFFIGLAAMALAMIVGHQDWLVVAYGSRIHFLHLPLIFIIPNVLVKQDFWKFRNALFYVAIPMTVLLIAQFIFPPDHFVNIGTGGVGSATFPGMMGKTRPPGTFSFITGTNAFYGMVTCFFFSSFFDQKKRMPILGWLIPFCLVIQLVFSVSRAAIFKFVLIFIGALLANFMTKKIKTSLMLTFLIFFVFLIGINTFKDNQLFQDAFFVTSQRFESANASESSENGKSEDDLISSALGAAIYRSGLGFLGDGNLGSLFGLGLGAFSSPALKRLENYSSTHGVPERPISFILAEYGFFLGLAFIFWKFGLFLKIAKLSLNAGLKEENPHGLIFLILSFLNLNFNFLMAPNLLGFIVFFSGIHFVTLNLNNRN